MAAVPIPAARPLVGGLKSHGDLDLETPAGFGSLGRFIDAGGTLYNIQHPRWGAKGNGTKDDTQAILDALQNVPPGAEVYFPRGDYLVSSPFLIGRGDITITGDAGARFVVDGKGVWLKFAGTAEAPLRHIVIRGMSFYDPDPESHVGGEESHGIVLNRVHHALIEDCSGESLGDESVDIQQSAYITVRRWRDRGGQSIGGVLASCVSLNTSRFCTIEDCVLEGMVNGNAIRIETSNQPDGGAVVGFHRVIGNRIVGGENDAIFVISGGNSDIEEIEISGNRIYSPGRSGIRVATTGANDKWIRGVTITNNRILGGGANASSFPSHRGAISVENRCEDVIVSQNRIRGWGTSAGHHGISVTDATVSHNRVRDIPDSGIYLGEGEGAEVVGNSVANCGTTLPSGARAGIRITTGGVAVGNRVRACYYGISAPESAEATNSLVEGNSVRDCTEAGVRVNGRGIATGNIIVGCKRGMVLSGAYPTALDNDIRESTAEAILNSATLRALTGTVSTESGSTTVTGAGTAFFREVSPGDTVRISGTDHTVALVVSDTELTLSASAATTAAGVAATNQSRRSATIRSKSGEFITERTFRVHFPAGAQKVRSYLHGMPSNVALRPEHVRLTPLGDLGSGRAWISSVNTTQFTITVEPALSADVEFAAAINVGW